MVFINIPYLQENNRIDKSLVEAELQALDISDEAKWTAFEAIYNRLPRGVTFAGDDTKSAAQLEKVLGRLGISYRQSDESEYIYSEPKDAS
jgi:hypothetical protein